MSHAIQNSCLQGVKNNLLAAGSWIKNHKLEIGLGVATTAFAVAAIAATVLTAGTAAAAFGGIGVGAILGSGAAVAGAATIGLGMVNHHYNKRAAADKAAADKAAAESNKWTKIIVGSVTTLTVTALATASYVLLTGLA